MTTRTGAEQQSRVINYSLTASGLMLLSFLGSGCNFASSKVINNETTKGPEKIKELLDGFNAADQAAKINFMTSGLFDGENRVINSQGTLQQAALASLSMDRFNFDSDSLKITYSEQTTQLISPEIGPLSITSKGVSLIQAAVEFKNSDTNELEQRVVMFSSLDGGKSWGSAAFVNVKTPEGQGGPAIVSIIQDPEKEQLGIGTSSDQALALHMDFTFAGDVEKQAMFMVINGTISDTLYPYSAIIGASKDGKIMVITGDGKTYTFPAPDGGFIMPGSPEVNPDQLETSGRAVGISLISITPTAIAPTPPPTELPAQPPTEEPTQEPTVPPTETIPTIDVDGLQVPDPKISNPELFDLTNPSSPIAKFANAFGVKPEEVGNLTPQLLTGADGKQFVVLTTGDLATTTNFDESSTPLLMAQQREIGEWVWRSIGLKDLENAINLEAGDSLVYNKKNDRPIVSDAYHMMMANNYSVITIAQGAYWKFFEREMDAPIDKYSSSDIKAQIQIIKNMKLINPNLKVRIHPFGSFAQANPDWLKGLSPDEAKIQLKQHMQQLYSLFIDNGLIPDEVVVVNEPFFQGSGWIRDDALYRDGLGYDYILYAFSVAQEIVGDKTTLIYNDTANNSETQVPYNFYTGLTKQVVEMLKNAGIKNFAVGMQMHLNGNAPVNENDLIQTMQNYGVPTYITELDVDTSMLPLEQRDTALTNIYTTVYRAAIKSSVCKGISTWNGVDDLTVAVDYNGNIDASPSMFTNSSNPQPKQVYYNVLKTLLSELNSK